MNAASAAKLGGALLLGSVVAFLVGAKPIPAVTEPAPVVFVCRNGVAMSVWSAAYFNRLAEARGLRERAISRAAVPSYRAVPLNMTVALALDGFRLAAYRPAVIPGGDAPAAEIIVAIDTELPEGVRPRAAMTEVWQGFPPMREQYLPSRAALQTRVEALVERLAAATPR